MLQRSRIRYQPQSKKIFEDSGLLKVPNEVEALRSDITALGTSINYIQESCDEAVKKAREAEAKVLFLENIVSDLQHQLQAEKRARLKLEADSRKYNLKIMGLKESKDTDTNLISFIQGTLKKDLDLDCDITNAYRLGRYVEGRLNPRPVIISFKSFDQKLKVLYSKKALNKAGLKITEDFPPDMENRVKDMLPSFIAAKKKGLNARLKQDELFLNGQKFTHEKLNTLPLGFRPIDLSKKENTDTVLFWGKANPLSNFYTQHNLMSEGDLSFISKEQYFFAAKAGLFEDDQALAHILSTKDPVEIKRTKIRNVDETVWLNTAPTIMKQGLRLKFEQNKHILDYLLSTGSKYLAESSPHDSYWGTGISMNQPQCFDRNSWGKNLLGLLLMELREELKR